MIGAWLAEMDGPRLSGPPSRLRGTETDREMNQHVTAERADPVRIQPTGREVVRLVGLKRRFGATAALDGVSLTVRRGEILGIIGRSGAGKSTLIRCLNGLERPDSGAVFIEDREIGRLSERELQPLRRRIGMVFQHFNLLSAKTVEENVALPLKIEGRPRAERLARAAELLQLVGLSEKANAYPASLSGGQKQRVGIARALAARPALLLSDEATSALDPETTRSILALLKDINSRLGLTILLITHEMEVIRSIADRVAVIDAGRIVEEGAVWQVFANPKSEITRSLLGGIRPQLPPEIASQLIAGEGAETILRIDVAGEAARGALLSDLAVAAPGRFRLVHGGVDHVQGQPVGTLFLAVAGAEAAHLARVTTFLKDRGARVEVLGHVAGPV
ncbi:DL-methionine transporter subunit; ATP-binding component of ABC superfamily [Mesorhizobium sp. SOD10]|nr:DL-methionine transporter subunit; ATP-binding component of ABC superfamily [Mesorhizobium sp. SOD10]